MAEGPVERRADILVEKGRIVEVAPGIVAPDAERVDATGMIVLPGFVDTHRHVWQTQLRTVATDWSLFDYVVRMRNVYSAFYTPEDAWLGNYAGALEALDAGVTTLVDHCHILNSPEHTDEAVRGLEEAGGRAIFCYGLFANPQHHPFVRSFEPGWRLDDARRLRRERLSGDSGRILMGLAPSEIEAMSFDAIVTELAFARELASHRISCHVAMGAYDSGKRLVKQLGARALLGEDLLFVHGAALTDEELALLRDAGAGLSATPETELQMGMGFPVAERASQAGVRSSLGIDIVSNYSGDMFAQMRLMLQTARATENALYERERKAPRRIRLQAWDVLRMATIGGAEAAGLAGHVGTIEKGKRADLQLIRTDALHMIPATDPVGAIVLNANQSDVDTVIVDGEIRKRGGRLVGIDVARLRERLLASRARLDEGFRSVDAGMVESAIEARYTHLA
jgi:cytosine/adenosine deaminase-related metal-dependent hydrolase